MKFYFFKSTNEKDSVSRVNIFTSTREKAIKLANTYFNKNNCIGSPIQLVI